MKWMVVVLLALGCVEVAEQRAKSEDDIGRATEHGLRVTVDEGLAAVREITPGRLSLWAQAPTLAIELDAEAAGEWVVELRNAMPTAELSGATATPEPKTLVTHKAWRLTLPAGPTRIQIAPPEATRPEPFRVLVFADVQDRLDGVQDLYRRMAEEPDVHFGLVSGDLTEEGDAPTLRRFQREMETLPFPLFATLGNHELGVGSESPPFHRYFGRGSFSFEYRGVRFTLLDAASATIAPRTYDKLKTWLAAGRDQAHLTMMHIPPLDPAGLRNGAFASRAEAHKLLGMLAKANVDLTIYGHVHTYRAFTNVGIEAYVTGGGGAIPQRFDGIGRHFMTLRVEPAAQRFVAGVVRIYPED